MRPLLKTLARFNIPVQTSIKLFHAYIEPIALYNAENWITLTEKQIENFSAETMLKGIGVSKADISHRKFLK